MEGNLQLSFLKKQFRERLSLLAKTQYWKIGLCLDIEPIIQNAAFCVRCNTRKRSGLGPGLFFIFATAQNVHFVPAIVARCHIVAGFNWSTFQFFAN